MKKLLTLISGFAICLLFVALCQAGPPQVTGDRITEQDIDKLLKYADKVIEDKDVEGVLSLIAGDALIGLKMPGPTGISRLSLTKDEYKGYLVEAWEATSYYSYRRENVKVGISPDGKIATVTDTVIETIVLNGERYKTVTEEESILELRGSHILTTSIEAVVLSLDKVE